MSDNNNCRNRHNKKRSNLPPNATLAEAFKRAGISANSKDTIIQVDKKRSENSIPPLPQQPVSDKDLFSHAIKGTIPLSSSKHQNTFVPSKSGATPLLAQNRLQLENNTHQVLAKADPKTIKADPDVKKEINDVFYKTAPDGRKKVVITGHWLDFGKELRNKSICVSKSQTSDLIVTGNITISPLLNQFTPNNFISFGDFAFFSYPRINDTDDEIELVIGLDLVQLIAKWWYKNQIRVKHGLFHYQLAKKTHIFSLQKFGSMRATLIYFPWELNFTT